MAKAQTNDSGDPQIAPVAAITPEIVHAASISPAARAAIGLLDRLETLLEDETGGLRCASIAEMKDLNRRKSQCLLELTRASRALEGEARDPGLAERITALRGALDRNQAALGVHIAAVREIAAIIADTIRAHESDGTYADRPQLRADAPSAAGEAIRSDAS
ncbi:MAG: hypothetical protein EA385_11995 [Salinarimonadaceae bacterium]|nr:MAG: hypothetical protein EA385_11995 [Salinarimonadaceae bacterium]